MREVLINLEVKWGVIIKGFYFEVEIILNFFFLFRRGYEYYVIILVYWVVVLNVFGSISVKRE